MRRLESIEDQMNGVVTYELSDGRRARFSARAVAEVGIAVLMREYGMAAEIPTKRLPVTQGGRLVGTMAPDFDPLAIKSTSFLYDPRPGDFRRVVDTWYAAPTLGLGDFECIPGFKRASAES